MDDFGAGPNAYDIGKVVLEQAGVTSSGSFGQAAAAEPSLSEYWRRNTSIVEATELANLIHALRKVTGYIGPNVGGVLWAGMSQAAGDTIVLDPELVMGDYPVHPGKVDYLVGLVVHEALLKTEWSDLVWSGLERASQSLGGRQKIVLQKIVHIGESIYVDHLSERSILGLYTRKCRGVSMELTKLGLNPSAVTVDELIYLWWLSAWEEEIEQPRLQAYEEPLNLLKTVLPKLKEIGSSGKGVIERCDLRRALYLKAFESVKDLVARWAIIDRNLIWYPPVSEEEKEKARKRQQDGSQGVTLSVSEALDIEASLAGVDSRNLTPIIRSIVGEDNNDVIPTSRFDFNIPAHPALDPHQVGRLKGIIQTYADRNIVISRGLSSGKVDRKRLYRAPISGRCFLDKQTLPELSWGISLLVDASGSMGRGQNWKLVESTVGALHMAFKGSHSRLQAFAYFESTGICMISSLIKGRLLMSVPPGGQTPSGQALIAAGYLMSRDKKRRFLIHLTDGASNCGVEVAYGIDYCRKENIQVITLGCGSRPEDIDKMLLQYGRTIQFLDHIGQLPGAVEKLLKWTLVYGARERVAA